MIDLRMRDLPNSVITDEGKSVLLNTDFRIWIRFSEDLKNDDDDRNISYVFAEEPPFINDFILAQLIAFLQNPSETPMQEASGERVLDYVKDGEYIFSALYATYGIDIIEMDMHWHKFQALCNNVIGEKTLWGYAKSMRGYQKPSSSDSYEKQCLRAKEMWSLPEIMTKEEIEKESEFEEYFSGAN